MQHLAKQGKPQSDTTKQKKHAKKDRERREQKENSLKKEEKPEVDDRAVKEEGAVDERELNNNSINPDQESWRNEGQIQMGIGMGERRTRDEGRPEEAKAQAWAATQQHQGGSQIPAAHNAFPQNPLLGGFMGAQAMPNMMPQMMP